MRAAQTLVRDQWADPRKSCGRTVLRQLKGRFSFLLSLVQRGRRCVNTLTQALSHGAMGPSKRALYSPAQRRDTAQRKRAISPAQTRDIRLGGLNRLRRTGIDHD
jgi:hypothetical protein